MIVILQVNPNYGSYFINSKDQNNWLSQKRIRGGQFIQVLNVVSESLVLGLLM